MKNFIQKIFFGIIAVFLLCGNSFAATMYLKAAGGDCTAAGTWSSTGAGGVDNAGPPTATTDAIAELASGALTVDSGCTMRSFNTTSGVGSYTGTITHTTAVTWTLGDATAGAGNVALKLNSGMTYTLGNAATSAITFASTSATQQTVDVGGKTVGNLVFGTSGTPNYAIVSAITTDPTASVTSAFGHLHFDGASDNSGLAHSFGFFTSSATNVRTIFLGTATITLSWNSGSKTVWNMSTTANITITPGTSSIIMAGNSVGGTTNSFTSGNKTYYALTCNGPNENSIGGTFTNLTRNGGADTAGRNSSQLNLVAGGTTKVTGTLTVLGESAIKRALIWPSSNGVPAILDITGATLNLQYCNFQDITFITGGVNLDLSAITGLSGDAGGNSMSGGGTLTFTPATTQHWLTTGAGNVSDVTKWTSRIPLPQDALVFDTVFTGSPKIILDMMFTGSLDFSSSTGTLSFSAGYSGANFVGNFRGRSGLTMTNEAASSIFMNSRVSTTTLTFNGCTWSALTSTSSSNGGNITVVDSGNIGASFTPRSGTITVPSGVTFGVDTVVSNANSASAPQVFNIIGTFNIRGGSGTIFTMGSPSLNSFTGGGIFGITSTSASSKTVAGGGITFPNVRITGGGSGAVIFTGANTFARLYTDGGGTKSITLPGSTTTTILSGLGLENGTNVITFTASAGSATIAKATGILSWDYVNLTNIPSSGTPYFFAGAHSTDGGGNTGWIFVAAPTTGGGGGSSKMGISL